jgi:hypothetical protein
MQGRSMMYAVSNKEIKTTAHAKMNKHKSFQNTDMKGCTQANACAHVHACMHGYTHIHIVLNYNVMMDGS